MYCLQFTDKIFLLQAEIGLPAADDTGSTGSVDIFAGALAETGLPQSNVPLALLAFNIGIELGQLAFIALLVLLFTVGAKLWGAHRITALRPLPIFVLGGLSAMWCIERGLEVLA